MTIESWRDGPQQKPVPEKYLREAERVLGAVFPVAFREKVLERNGGLLRTGSRYWYLQPIEHPSQPLPRLKHWAERGSLTLYAFHHLRYHDGRRGIAIAFSPFDYGFGDSLYLLEDPKNPGNLLPEVWRWGYVAPAPVKLLDHVGDLWRDNPYKVQKPKLNWKLRPRKYSACDEEKRFRRISRKASPEQPVTSEWLASIPFSLLGENLLVCDLPQIPSESDKGIRLGKGSYLVQRRAIAYGSDVRNSGARILREGTIATRCEVIDRVMVDLAAITLHDLDQALLCERSVLEELSDRLMDVSLDEGHKVMLFGPTTLVSISSGFGDGTYPVHALRDQEGQLVGLELEFIPPATPYALADRVSPTGGADDKLPRWLAQGTSLGRTGQDIIDCISRADGAERWQRMNTFQVMLRNCRKFPLSGNKARDAARIAEYSSNFLEHMFACRCHLSSSLRLMEECHGAATIKGILEYCRAIGAEEFSAALAPALALIESETRISSGKKLSLAARLSSVFDEYPWRDYEAPLRDTLPAAQAAWQRYVLSNLGGVDFVAEFQAASR